MAAFRFTRRTSLWMVASTWLSSLLLISLSDLVLGLGWEEETGTCTVLGGPARTLLFGLVVGAPYLVICLCYIAILVTLRRSGRKVKASMCDPISQFRCSAITRFYCLFSSGTQQ